MEEQQLVLRMICSLAFLVFFCCMLHLYKSIWLKSQMVRKQLQIQGIKGPSPCLFYGNLHEMKQIQFKAVKKTGNHSEIVAHDYAATLFPYLKHWSKDYGPVYTYSTGFRHHLYINDPELVKEMNQSSTLDLGKPSYTTKMFAPILGNGILRSNGHIWAQQRKIVAPEFFMDKVKSMVGLMVKSAQPLLRKWEEITEAEGGLASDIKVDEDLRSLSAEVISMVCFGSSHFKGKQIFSKLRILQKAISNQNFLFGVTSFGKRFQISSLEREIDSLIWNTVVERQRENLETASQEKDLMQIILDEAAASDTSQDKISSKRFIIDNLKNIYFAGHESTAVAASWCLMLLALHPQWQSHLRAELNQFCKNGLPDTNSLTNLKTMTMVIQETLRLYPPGAFVAREALEETQIGDIIIPKGVNIWTLIPSLHRDPDVWGPDANKFKPERFINGVSKACRFPQAYIPFGLGTRICMGRNFAMVQLKVVLALIVSRFSFSLSPNHQHSPIFRMIVEPEHGVYIHAQKISPGLTE